VTGSGFRPTGPSSAGELNCLSLVGGVAGVVSSLGVVGDVSNSIVAFKPMTVADLALRVIPLINNLKTQLGEVQLAVNVIPSMTTILNQLKTDVVVLKANYLELKNNYVVLNARYSVLDERLVKTNAVLKSLDDWSVAYDFSRVNHGFVPFPMNQSAVAPLTQVFVNASVSPDPLTSKVDEGHLTVATNPAVISLLDFDNLIV